MKHIFLFPVLAAFSAHVPVATAQYINMNLSVKVVLGPNLGVRPGNISDARIDSIIAEMNKLQTSYARGLKFERVDPIVSIGHQGDTTGPSRWFNVDFTDPVNGRTWRNEMESAAKSDPAYAWNNNAINVYITAGTCGAICSSPEEGHDIIIFGFSPSTCGSFIDLFYARIILHEIGHFFGLYHTQGRTCGCADPTKTGECNTSPGDDEIADTLPDLSNWDLDQIAGWSFGGRSYQELSAVDKDQVDNVYLNVMSYHGSRVCGTGTASTTRMTERQLDRWADNANGNRISVMSGRTWFVDRNNQCNSPAGGSGCTVFNFGGPFRHVADAVGPAASGDTLLIRPGSYNEQFTISKSLTLRASRAGAVTIGR